MSFKREGNDSNQLGILRKRRVRELLGLAVPEDEALLMSNGRFACLVCGHRPVFDTVDMLILHRQGKKHMANVEYEAEKKVELKNLIEKRKHDQYMKDGSSVIHQKQTSCRGLGIGAPYDPRAKKPRPHERKQKLDFTGSISKEPVATTFSALPGNKYSLSHHQGNNSKDELDPSKRAYNPKDDDNKTGKKSFSNQSFRDLILQQTDSGPVKHSKQLKKIFMQEKSTDDGNISNCKPYVRSRTQSDRKYGDRLAASSNAIPQLPSQNTSLQPNLPPNSFHYSKHSAAFPVGDSATCEHPAARGCNLKPLHQSEILALAGNPPPPPPHKRQTRDEKFSTQSETAAWSEERKKKAEMYLQCRGAGWKKDLTGKWIRDEDAEFDSDEEPPDLP
ncbi:sodium channel modifier 1-like [Ylistrum balloti]|uniref:sodium channel modifier 1-like n=1 Tax=Ylistrum balloti TaxID=509963 RepID=UPI002905BF2A|nr:sodium channel modifier 1-like [Ylistrum balloti]